MTTQTPVGTGQQMPLPPVAERQAWSRHGVVVLVAGVVALIAGVAVLWYAGKQAGGAGSLYQ